jgi:sulfatase maturation enzyme AslB (radical SAM superfamily)
MTISRNEVQNFSDCAHVLQYIAKYIGIKFTIKGGKHLTEPKTSVVVVNHQSSLDALGGFENRMSASLKTNVYKFKQQIAESLKKKFSQVLISICKIFKSYEFSENTSASFKKLSAIFLLSSASFHIFLRSKY